LHPTGSRSRPRESQNQQQQIEREASLQAGADWLLDFSDDSSPFADVDVEYYLSLVEWTGRTMRADKPGSISVEMERVLDRFGIDARHWASNVRSYGRLFYRIAGRVEQQLGYAQRRGSVGSSAVSVCMERGSRLNQWSCQLLI
jgi:putative transposase